MAQSRNAGATAHDFYEKAKQAILDRRFGEAICYYDFVLTMQDDGSVDSETVTKTHKFLANAYFENGQYNFSMLHNTIAIKRDANQPDVHYNRSLAFLGLARPDAACADLKRCLELDPDFDGASELLDKLTARTQKVGFWERNFGQSSKPKQTNEVELTELKPNQPNITLKK